MTCSETNQLFMMTKNYYFACFNILYTSSNPHFKGMLLPFGETRIYPCISWCKAEQKSVQ